MLIGLDGSNGQGAHHQRSNASVNVVYRHPQMGELPVISMTQASLNSMIEQATQQRQNNMMGNA